MEWPRDPPIASRSGACSDSCVRTRSRCGSLSYSRRARLSFGFYDRHQTGQLMSRATVDLQAVRFFLGYGLIFFFQHVITLVGVTAVMFVVNWRLALAATVVTPFIVVLAYRYSHVAHPVLR